MDPQALGRYLRESRESREISLDEAVAALRIRRPILEAFEQGNFDVVETPVQARGLLRNYARFLKLDEDKVLQYYEAAKNPTHRRRGRGPSGSPVAPRKITDTPPTLPTVTLPDQRPNRLRNLMNTIAVLLVSLAALAVIVFVTVEIIRTPEDDLPGPESTAGAFVGQLPPTATFTPSWTPRPEQPTPTPPLSSLFSGQGVLAEIELRQRTWLRLSVDGVETFTGIVTEGDVLRYEASERIDITASNAAALDLTYNGRSQGSVGVRGQRVELTLTTDGINVETGPGMEPTPENSPTPPPTPTSIAGTVIAVLTPSPTPGPSPTPSDTPTITLTPSITPTPSDTPTATMTPSITPTASDTPTITPTPTNTLSPTPTALLPVRATATGQAPTKPPE